MNHRKEDRKLPVGVRARLCLHERIKAIAREDDDPLVLELARLRESNRKLLADFTPNEEVSRLRKEIDALKLRNYQLDNELNDLKESLGIGAGQDSGR